MFRNPVKITVLLHIAILLLLPVPGHTQELYSEYKETWRGKVLEVAHQEQREVPGTGTEHTYQTLEIEILDGPRKGEEVVIENDYLTLDKGDKFYFNYLVYIDGEEVYAVVNIDRRDSLLFFGFLFVAAVIALGGWQGVRSLLALAGSLAAIFYVLLPGLLQGWNPLLLSFAVASAILFGAIFFTHGFNRESAVAYSGTMITVFLTGLCHCDVIEYSKYSNNNRS